MDKPLYQFSEAEARLLGFKFLRLREAPLAQLKKIDGDQAPHGTLPTGGAVDF